ncbi:MAG: DUF4145 domain-containing protein [Rhodobacteraceae bacterium]|nr:DUF4145 domain-containing protein [Paracoccaceae bacterium]
MSKWKCNCCDHSQIAVRNHTEFWNSFEIKCYNSKYGNIKGEVKTLVCANEECNDVSVEVSLENKDLVIIPPLNSVVSRSSKSTLNRKWSLFSNRSFKLQPNYIPNSIVKNYQESCLICELSPNASATLSRRCLQGMIRDFCKISGKTLHDEIQQLREKVAKGDGPSGVGLDSINAIDSVREIGNIGAHMQKDVNLILDVEPDIAKSLIKLIELLFNEWYVASHDRKEFLRNLELTNAKMKKKKQQANSPTKT